MRLKPLKKVATGLAFLSPNILGFAAFTLIPLVFSLVLAFSNWDLKLHNMFRDNPINFIGLNNFIHLLGNHDFHRFFANTLFFMIGIPFSIAGSLFLAVLLTKNLHGKNRRAHISLVCSAIVIALVAILGTAGFTQSAMMVVLVSLAGIMLISGAVGGSTVYRTFFYLPAFTSGIAVYLLWKQLYNPRTGPINSLLGPIFDSIESFVNACPALLIQSFSWGMLAMIIVIVFLFIRRIRLLWQDGEIGSIAIIFPVVLISLPIFMTLKWLPNNPAAKILLASTVLILLAQLLLMTKKRNEAAPVTFGIGTWTFFAIVLMTFEFVLVGLAMVLSNLPSMAASMEGLGPPQWLTDYHWAKPAIMIMMFWTMVGSNNMLLYIAGISNIPVELYEASDIDGASTLDKFWNITWPQLAPTTFFISIMSIIYGMQGGFEMARSMTQGGPAGATTTLSYFIYTEGFESGRLGYASAIAWILFAIIFLLTLLNWKVGSRYVNE